MTMLNVINHQANDNSMPGSELFDSFHSCRSCQSMKFHVKQVGRDRIDVICEVCGVTHAQIGVM